MGLLQGVYEVECFLTNEDMREKEYPEENTETFRIDLGEVEYYRNHLQELRDRMKEECGYYFDVGKLADALYHLREIDGFLTNGVLKKGETGGYAIPLQYRTDKPYPLRVRISQDGWYVIAPCMDQEQAQKIGLNSGEENE